MAILGAFLLILFFDSFTKGMRENDFERRIELLEEKYTTEIENLKKTLSEEKKFNRKLADRCERLEDEVKSFRIIGGSELDRNIQKRLLLNDKLTSASQSTSVAFYVRLITNNTAVGERETIKFNTVVTNIGNGYDINNGIFFCPVSGIYLFAATIASLNGSDKNIDVEIVHQGNAVAHLHATIHGIDMASQIAVLHCQHGEKVWLRHVEAAGDSKLFFGDYSGFTGVLISSL